MTQKRPVRTARNKLTVPRPRPHDSRSTQSGQSSSSSKQQQEQERLLEELKRDEKHADHIVPLDQLLARLDSSLLRGLDSELAARRLLEHGPNRLPIVQMEAAWRIAVRQLTTPFSLLLWAATILCFGCYFAERSTGADVPLDNILLGSVILFIVMLGAGFGFVQEKRGADIICSFQKMVKPSTTVLRDGMVRNVPVEDLVVGDLVFLAAGDGIAADLRIVESNQCKVDCSALTGESDPVTLGTAPTDQDPMRSLNMAFFSTKVVEGRGRGVVVRTAAHSSVGRIAALTAQIAPRQTALDRNIKRFLLRIMFACFTLNIVIFIISIAIGYSWVSSLIIMLGLLSSTIPEGLPLAVTLCLTLTAKRMRERKCLVKNLGAVATIGQTSVVCSDKTGTLTMNRMAVTRLWFCRRMYALIRVSETTEVDTLPAMERDADLAALVQVATLCTHALPTAPGEVNHIAGDATETAILKFVEQKFGGVAEMKIRFPRLYSEPFSSSKKFQVSVHALQNNKSVVAVMGAPEIILKMSTKIRISGKDALMSPELRTEVTEACESMAERGQRVVAFCRSLIPTAVKVDFKSLPLKDMVFLGLVALEDPPRAAVPRAVASCREAGIKVVMITGDHPTTAKSIAKQVGIFSEGGRMVSELARQRDVSILEVEPDEADCLLMTGTDIEGFDKNQIATLVSRFPEVVFARTTPTQKLLIVESFQSTGNVVAATGDGVNDSPALKGADVGVAMGSGTEVTKEAADMILIDDNFTSIVTAIQYGRIVADNLQKAVVFVLTSNVPETATFILQVTLNIPGPLSVMLVLAIDCLTDLWPAISMAYEPPEGDVMRRLPRDAYRNPLINNRLLAVAYFQVGGIQTAAAITSYFMVFMSYGFFPPSLIGTGVRWQDKNFHVKNSYGKEWSVDERLKLMQLAQTATFMGVVLTQIADVLISRCRRDSTVARGCNNVQLILAIFVMVAVPPLMMYVPALREVFRVQPLPFMYWIPGTLFAVFLLLADELRRFIIRHSRENSWLKRITFYE